MDLQKGIPVTHVSHEDIIKAMTTCVLCGAHLAFKRVTDFIQRTVTEMAECPTCKIKSKTHEFKLQ